MPRHLVAISLLLLVLVMFLGTRSTILGGHTITGAPDGRVLIVAKGKHRKKKRLNNETHGNRKKKRKSNKSTKKRKSNTSNKKKNDEHHKKKSPNHHKKKSLKHHKKKSAKHHKKKSKKKIMGSSDISLKSSSNYAILPPAFLEGYTSATCIQRKINNCKQEDIENTPNITVEEMFRQKLGCDILKKNMQCKRPTQERQISILDTLI